MIKTLTKHGNSYALIIDKPILDLLKIDIDTPLEITTDGSALHIEPAKLDEKKAAFRKKLVETGAKNAELFRRLAR